VAKHDVKASAGLSDHDLLIRIDERVQKLDRCMTNHLRHHWMVTVAALTAAAGAVAAALML
jgi:hypothetical protein